MQTKDGRVLIERTRAGSDPQRLREELAASLRENPPRIPSKLFYDERGSELFERITTLPEYYPTRTERRILETIAGDLARRTRAEELVELGPGAARKTRTLLSALAATGRLRRYVPLDVSEAFLRRIAEELAAEYPDLRIHAVVSDFLEDLEAIPPGTNRLVIFLGGTIGNLRPAQAAAFLERVGRSIGPRDRFLLGLDLVKPAERLEAAYNDAQGVTAAFNRNILRVVNRLAGGDFEVTGFDHRAVYDRAERRIEMSLVSRRAQTARLRELDLELRFAPGDVVLTEISAKFERADVERLFAGAGLALEEWFTDPEELFALALARSD